MQTAAWERFQTQWNAYNTALKQQPEIWKRIQAQHEKLAGSFANLGDKVAPISDTHADLTTAAEDQEKALSHTAELWGGIGAASGRTARNIEAGTKGLLKWAGIFAGVGTVLGGLGLDVMTHFGRDVFGWGKSATGLGLTVGQERSFGISYARLLGNPGAFLSGVNVGETDVASPAYRAMQMFGVDTNAPAGQASAALMQKIFSLSHQLPKNMLGPYAQAMGLGAFGIGAEDLMRYRAMSPAQFAQLQAIDQMEAKILNLDAATTAAWTNFTMKLDLAKAGIENVFIKLLTPLATPLAHLATGFEHLLQVLFAKNGTIAQDIDGFAAWMNKLNNKDLKDMGSKIGSAIGNFVTGVQDMAMLMQQVAEHPLLPWTWGTGPHDNPIKSAWNLTRFGAAGRVMTTHNPGNLKYAGQSGATLGQGGFANFASDAAGLFAMGRQLELYGARGLDTVQSIISAYAPASDKNDVPAYIRDVDKYLGVRPDEALNLLNPRVLTALMRAMILHEQGYSPYRGSTVNQAAQDVLGRTSIIIRDKTSLGVHAQVAAQGATP